MTAAEITAWLDYENEALVRRRDQITAAFTTCLDSIKHVDDDETLGILLENTRMAKALIGGTGTAEMRRKEQKRPFLEGSSMVDGWFKRLAAPLAPLMAQVQALMDDYGRRKEAECRAEAEQLAAIARKEETRRLAEAQAALAAQAPEAESAIDEAAAASAAAAKAAALATGRAAELTRMVGEFGAVGSLRTTWGYEVDLVALVRAVAIGRVPIDALVANHAWIKDQQRTRDASGRPIAAIPGVTWVATQKMSVR
jgi:hypothetical protein